MDHQSLIHLFEASVEKFSDNVFLWEKPGNEYKGMSYKDTAQRVYNLFAGLKKLGVKKGDRIALISEGCNDWLISELAILYCGAICVPLSVKIDEPADLFFRLKHSGCKGIFVSPNHRHKVFSPSEPLPDLEFVAIIDNELTEDEPAIDEKTASWQVFYVNNLVDSGQEYLHQNPGLPSQARENIQPSDLACISYTSGTSSDPKGVMLTHQNFLVNVWQALEVFDVPSYYTSLFLLPWDHSFTHTVGLYTLMKNGASIASLKTGKTINETLRNVPGSIRDVRPFFLLSVPALAKNFRKNIEKGVRENGKIAWWLFRFALIVATKYNREGYNRGKGMVFLLKPLVYFFDYILFSKIRKNFGGRLRFFVGGGALLDISLQRFFYATGIPMFQGYGLTEASPVISSNTPEFHKLGSSGKVVPMIDLKICSSDNQELPVGKKGEIVIKGDNVMAGYWKNEKATSQTIRDGWLYTGDQGYIDEDGFLYVLGRTKSLLIGSDGEKYSPEGIEEAIVERSPFFDQVVLYNNQNPYTSALIVINKSAVLSYLKKLNLDPDSSNGQEAALQRLKQEFSRFMAEGELREMFPSRWLPSAAYLISEPFSEKNGLLNSTMKIVRFLIIEKYQGSIDFLYTPEGKDMDNEHNRAVIKSLK